MFNSSYTRRTSYYLLLIAFCCTSAGCKKFTDVSAPSGSLVTATVFTNDHTVQSTLAGMYTTLINSDGYDIQMYLNDMPSASADELVDYAPSTDTDPFINNALTVDNAYVLTFWTDLYQINYQANAIISGLQGSSGVSAAVRNAAMGQALFMRAFCHFYLVNLYGDVPLVTTTDAIRNTLLPRTATDSVYQQIIADLTAAKSLLPADYSLSGTAGERITPNKYAATALLARAYLYTGDWANAAANADSVIGKSALYSLQSSVNIGKVFTKNNSEAIWQMSGSSKGYTLGGQNYYYAAAYQSPYLVLSSSLLNAFETGDLRYTNWVSSYDYDDGTGTITTYYYPYKYKQYTTNTTAAAEYFTFLRLAEQYLIRAEARAEQNNLSGAAADINIIRTRAGLGNTSATTQSDLLLAVEQERRIELFNELAQRWFDLKRTGRANTVLGATKPGWTKNAALYPIPRLERNNDVNLTQNPGY